MAHQLSDLQDLLRRLRSQSEQLTMETLRLQTSLSTAVATRTRSQRNAHDLAHLMAEAGGVGGQLHHLVRGMPHLVFRRVVVPAGGESDPERRCFFYGADGPGIVGTGNGRLGLDPEVWHQRIHPEDRETYREAEAEREHSGRPRITEFRVVDPATAEPRWLRETGWTATDRRARVIYLDSYILDISQDKRAEAMLQASADRYRALVQLRPEYIRCFDRDRRLTFVNDAYCRRLGRPRVDLLGSDLLSVIPPTTVEATRQQLALLSPWHAALTYEVGANQPDGSVSWEEWSEQALFDGADELVEHWSIGRDVTARKNADEHILHLAYHDALTGLPNRLLFDDRLQQALARGARARDGFALMIVDLDDFKRWNDDFGHLFGDRLLQAVAQRLHGLLRASDTLARFGGDEFVILQGSLRLPSGAATLARTLNRALAQRFVIDDQAVEMSASIGIVLYPDGGRDAGTLIRVADTALYQAKRDGGNRHRFGAPGPPRPARSITARHHLQRDLDLALERGEFFLLYQPRFDLPSNRAVAVEALVRWQHPRHGTMLPARFIPIAEANDRIGDLGSWILAEACRQSASWQTGGETHAISVNLSPAQIAGGELAAQIGELLERLRLPPDRLELEITEGMVVDLADRSLIATLHQLAALGVRLAIDDFGRGYSSLAYLSRLPIHTLKIDRSFIRNIGRDPADETIIRAVIGLAHNLGRRVVAEGVETRRQLTFLRHEGCDEAQGYLFSPPLPAASAAGYLRGYAATA
jgi:diguanylate cyclase (GGDEF)-like protein/PAS domain S-box-containing protein